MLEGASEGVGLGDEFLAHLERAPALPARDRRARRRPRRFQAIDRELAAYGAGLAERPQLVILNKVDLVAEPPAFDLDDPRVVGVVATSAVTGAGIDELQRSLFALVPEGLPVHSGDEELADFVVYRPRPPHQRRFRSSARRGLPRAGQGNEDELRAAGVKPDAVVEFENE